MKLLLDTHALLWWLDDDRRLEDTAREAIADPDNAVLISVASLWEVAIKVRVGKLRADVAVMSRSIDRDGFTMLAIDGAHLSKLIELPFHQDHRDPFDHLLIAQAIVESATFVSEDGRLSRYPVKTLQCSNRPLQLGPS